MSLLPSARVVGVAALLAGAIACAKEKEPQRVAPGGGSGTGVVDASAGAGGSTGAGAAACDDLEGPFGIEEGDILDPALSWPGFEAGETQPGTVSLESYATCGEGEEVTALVVYVDALWCPVCRDVASTLADRYASSWKARGVRVVTLVTETEEGAAADVEAAYRWRDTFDLWDLAVAYDPTYSLNPENPDRLPQALVVDPKTMRVVARHVGKVDLEPTIEAVIEGTAE